MPTCSSQNPTKPSIRRPFRPQPYLFRMEDAHKQMIQMTPDECLSANVRCPEFHILLDHAIAVLWLCYTVQPGHRRSTADRSSSSSIAGSVRRAHERLQRLSTVQLQWAIRFLQTIRNEKGQQSVDVVAAIENLQDIAFQKYANAATSTVTLSTIYSSVSSLVGSELSERTRSAADMQSDRNSLPNIRENIETNPVSNAPISSARMGLVNVATKLNQLLSQLCPNLLSRLFQNPSP